MKKTRSVALKPRNPFVAAVRFRRAGPHAPRAGSRQAVALRLRKEVLALKENP